FGQGELSDPAGVAVNEETGDIYVLDSAKNRVVVYGPNHELIKAWSKSGFDSPIAIAVDNASGSPSHGDVYVVANRDPKHEVVDKFSASGKLLDKLFASKEEHEEFETNPIVGDAVDSTGTVWVDREGAENELVIERLNDAVQNEPLGKPEEVKVEQLPGPLRPGLALSANGGLYVTYEPAGHTLEEQQEEEAEIAEEEKELKREHEPP